VYYLPKDCLEKLLAKIVGEEKTLSEILTSKELASLGYSFLNFVYSVAKSLEIGCFKSLKVSNSVLAEAVRRAGLRQLLPKRLSRREIGGAAEALLVYAVAREIILMDEIIEKVAGRSIEEALTDILREIVRRLPLEKNRKNKA
jgi:hypothetical protein